MALKVSGLLGYHSLISGPASLRRALSGNSLAECANIIKIQYFLGFEPRQRWATFPDINCLNLTIPVARTLDSSTEVHCLPHSQLCHVLHQNMTLKGKSASNLLSCTSQWRLGHLYSPHAALPSFEYVGLSPVLLLQKFKSIIHEFACLLYLSGNEKVLQSGQ